MVGFLLEKRKYRWHLATVLLLHQRHICRFHWLFQTAASSPDALRPPNSHKYCHEDDFASTVSKRGPAHRGDTSSLPHTPSLLMVQPHFPIDVRRAYSIVSNKPARRPCWLAYTSRLSLDLSIRRSRSQGLLANPLELLQGIL